jgi:cytochrome c oxidase cbb3-type subunit 4
MTPAWGHIVGVFTLFVMIVFLAIWAWAWLPHHKHEFQELASLPMEDGKDGR